MIRLKSRRLFVNGTILLFSVFFPFLLLAQPAQVQSTNSSEAGSWPNSPQSSTTPNFGSTVTLNNYIVVQGRACINNACTTTTPTGSLTISDTLGLNWNACGALTASSRQAYLAIWIAKITSTGAEAVKVTCSGCGSINYGGVYAREMSGTGLTGIGGLCDVSGESEGTTLSGGAFSISTSGATNFSSEFLVSDIFTVAGGCSIVPSGWTGFSVAPGAFDQSGSAGSVQTAAWTGCINNGDEVEALIAAFHDGTPPCSGTSPNLTSADWAHVQLCHDNVAVNGDTITVTSGSFTVTTTTSLTKAITVQAQGGTVCNLGSPSVTLTDNTANLSDMIDITENAAGSVVLKGFCISQGTGQHSNPNGVIHIGQGSSGKPVVITGNNYATNSPTGDFIIANTQQGVINLNGMQGSPASTACINQNAFVRQKLSGQSSYWAAAAPWGSADTAGNQWLYVEGNTVSFANQALDVDDNARMSVRWNTFTNSSETTHGVDTSGVDAGRAVDFSHNLWINDQTTTFAACAGGPFQTNNENTYISIHNGGAQIHDNTIPDPSSGWGAHAAIGFFVEALRRIGNIYSCWGTRTGGGAGYPAPHQVGWGWNSGTNITIGPFNTFPLPGSSFSTSVTQASDPVYLWNNTGTGNYANPAPGDYPNDAVGTSCNNQVATFSSLVAGSGYSNGSGIGTTDTTGGALGNSLAVDITTSTGQVTGLTLENGALLYGQLYNVGDVLSINGGGNNATFTVASIKWSDTTSDLPKTSDYVQSGRDFFTATSKPGYSDATCPNVFSGLAGSCTSTHGVAGYDVVGNSQTFTQVPTNTVSGTNFSPTIVVTLSSGGTDSMTLSLTCSGVSLTGTTTVSAIAGVATFTGVGVTGTPNVGCVLKSHDNTDGTVADITAGFNATGTLTYSSQPTNITSGNIFGPAIMVQVTPAATDSVTISMSGCVGTLTGTLTVTANGSGLATFTAVGATGNATGCKINAHDNTNSTGAIADQLSSSFNITQPVSNGKSGRIRVFR